MAELTTEYFGEPRPSSVRPNLVHIVGGQDSRKNVEAAFRPFVAEDAVILEDPDYAFHQALHADTEGGGSGSAERSLWNMLRPSVLGTFVGGSTERSEAEQRGISAASGGGGSRYVGGLVVLDGAGEVLYRSLEQQFGRTVGEVGSGSQSGRAVSYVKRTSCCDESCHMLRGRRGSGELRISSGVCAPWQKTFLKKSLVRSNSGRRWRR